MSQDEQQIAGMTVNERLFHFGLSPAFDKAVRSKDATSVVAVLQRAKLSEAQAKETAAAVLSSPSHYGY